MFCYIIPIILYLLKLNFNYLSMEEIKSLEVLIERIRDLFNCRVICSPNSCDGFYDLSILGIYVDIVYCRVSLFDIHNILLHYLHAFNLLNTQK